MKSVYDFFVALKRSCAVLLSAKIPPLARGEKMIKAEIGLVDILAFYCKVKNQEMKENLVNWLTCLVVYIKSAIR